MRRCWRQCPPFSSSSFFFFNDTATTEIYTLSLHDALPICPIFPAARRLAAQHAHHRRARCRRSALPGLDLRSEEHTSELQSQFHLVCRLLLEKKKERQRESCWEIVESKER